ncbi:hypothetical protein DM806_24010 [Sphingobium lactosutens]|uniref:hypothetical protein n=1 Tax=Sphingobium lactosutens TaxID=522773 RepID=UPI0015BD7A1F|nr:hypothetical protein [Sphingobium lactosutens]NWK98671.1 hypothetical protein [Sphingobium lactosutens]
MFGSLSLGLGMALAQPVWPLPDAPIILKHLTSTTGITANSGATLANEAFPEPHPSGATNGVAVTCIQSDTFCGARVPVSGFRLADAYLVGMWIYWGADQGSVALRFTSDAFASKTKTFSWPWSGQLHKGWNLLTVNPAGAAAANPGGAAWTVAGAFADTEAVNWIEIQIATNGAAATKIYLGGIFYHTARPYQGAVCLGFDQYGSAGAGIVDYGLPIFETHRIKGYWAGDANLIQNPGTARTLLRTVCDLGWDPINQGLLHPNYANNPTQLTSDIGPSRQIFLDAGFPGTDRLFSYPLSANNAATDLILANAGIIMARSGWAWAIHPNNYGLGPKLIGHGGTNIGGMTLTQVKALFDYWRYYGLVGFPFAHNVVPGGDGTAPPANALNWYANDLDALIAYGKSIGLAFETPTSLLRKFRR